MKEKNVNGGACYSEHVFVRIEWGYKRVCIHDILYLEAQQDCCNIYLLKENKVSRIMVTIPMCEVFIPNRSLEIRHVYFSNDLGLSLLNCIPLERSSLIWSSIVRGF